MRDFCNRRRKSEGKPPIGELGKKRRLNRRKNAKRRKRLLIGPGRQRVSGVELIRRGDGRTMNVRRRKAAGTWIDRKEWREARRAERAEDAAWREALRHCELEQRAETERQLQALHGPPDQTVLTLSPRVERDGAPRESFSAGRLTLRPRNQT